MEKEQLNYTANPPINNTYYTLQVILIARKNQFPSTALLSVQYDVFVQKMTSSIPDQLN